MLIVWGKTLRRRPRGNAVAFCPICRWVKRFETVSVCQCPHLYYVPLSSGDHVADEAVCTTCRTVYGAGAGAFVDHWEPFSDPEHALSLMDSEAAGWMRRRLEVEARAMEDPANDPERLALIAEPFGALQYEHESGMARSSGRSLLSVLQLLGVFAVGGTLLMWGIQLKHNPSPANMKWALGFTAASAVFVPLLVWEIRRGGRAAARRRSLPRIAQSLERLQPSEDELEYVLKQLAASGNTLAACVTPAMVTKAIDASSLRRGS